MGNGELEENRLKAVRKPPFCGRRVLLGSPRRGVELDLLRGNANYRERIYPIKTLYDLALSPPRLKFELMAQQSIDRTSSPLLPLRTGKPRLIHDLAEGLEFLIEQLTKAEEERDHARIEADGSKAETLKIRGEFDDLQREFKAASQGTAELRATRKTLEDVIGEQQKALMLSMALMQHLETEVGSLRTRMDAIETAPAAAAESERLREEIACLKKQPDPSAAIRAIEDQRDIARIEAASARTQLSIQAAELEAKDVLISALERAIEQQRESLQSLESRVSTFATRLEGTKAQLLEDDPGSSKISPLARLLRGVKRGFSPSVKGTDAADALEEPGQ